MEAYSRRHRLDHSQSRSQGNIMEDEGGWLQNSILVVSLKRRSFK